MRNWLIYEPAGGARATLEDTERFVFVREGFSKAVFLLAPFWLGWRRCWRTLALWAAAMVLVAAIVSLLELHGAAAMILVSLPSLAVGYEAAWIRARALEKSGFRLAGSAMARTQEEAEALFFSDWLKEAKAAEDRRPTAPAPASTPYRPAPAGVLGLFPQAGGSR